MSNFENHLEQTRRDRIRRDASERSQLSEQKRIEALNKRSDGTSPAEIFMKNECILLSEFLSHMKQRSMPQAEKIPVGNRSAETVKRSGLLGLLGFTATEYKQRYTRGYTIGIICSPYSAGSDRLFKSPSPKNDIEKGIWSTHLELRQEVIPNSKNQPKIWNDINNTNLIKMVICEDGKLRTSEGFSMPANKSDWRVVTGGIVTTHYVADAGYYGRDCNEDNFIELPLEKLLPVYGVYAHETK